MCDTYRQSITFSSEIELFRIYSVFSSVLNLHNTMTSFLNRVFGKNTQSLSKKGASTGTTSLSSSTPPMTPLDLPYVNEWIDFNRKKNYCFIPCFFFVVRQWIPPDFNRDNVRLLVFSDSDDVGIELIFDSKTLRVVPSSDNENLNNKPLTTVNTRTSLTHVPSTNVRFIYFFSLNFN